MNIFATDHPMAAKRMSRRTKIIIASSAALLIAVTVLFIRHLDGPRVVGRAVAPDGTEMCIVQQCNWNAELFTTSFVYRKPGTSWRRFYYDHQDDYWGRASASLDSDTRVAVFYRGSSPAVTFAWATETYFLHRWRRTDKEPDQMPVGWSPQMSAFSER
jgi:hypothetical protein